MTDEDIVEEAQRAFKECEGRESEARRLWKADLRFANGDPENGYQWDDALKKSREMDPNGGRPCLTTNKVKTHNRQITNDARQNKPSIRVSPVDDKADKKTAEVLNGIIRHIEKNSSADTAYDVATEFAVDAGLGYWRVTTDYAADDSFEQEIFIKVVTNPLNVYLGPHTEPDGSDAKCGFVFEDLSKEEFEARFPGSDPIGWPQDEGTAWLSKDSIRIAEYFRIIEERDTLFADEQGNPVLLSSIEDEAMAAAIKADEKIKKRTVSKRRCKWYLITGDKVKEKRDWPGRYIPIIRVVGEEVLIDGKIERKGHTRPMKDAQRMYNYWSSAAVEYGALQGKQPYLAAAEAIEGYEAHWAALNTSHAAYIPYNAFDDANNPIPMPQRQMPPVTAPMYMEGMRVASEEMKMASGQYDASMGAKSNETSGRAIIARQNESDNATFHFIDNVARAIKYTGRILIDLIPKIYDTPRVVRMLGEDGSEDSAHLDPTMPGAYRQERDLNGAIREIYNPSVGRYDVDVRVGPSYGTKRQEAFQALTEMSSRSPELMQIAGDLVFQAADFPMAQELSERWKKTLPPALQEPEEGEEEVPPQAAARMAQLSQGMQQMQQMGAEMEQQLQDVQQQLMQEKASRLKAELDAKEAKALLRISDAEQAMQDRLRQQQEAFQQQQEPAPEAGFSLPEQPQEQPVAEVLAPLMQQVAGAVDRTGAAIEQLAMGQQQIVTGLQGQAMRIDEALRSRASSIQLRKQGDGSWSGTRVEE